MSLSKEDLLQNRLKEQTEGLRDDQKNTEYLASNNQTLSVQNTRLVELKKKEAQALIASFG